MSETLSDTTEIDLPDGSAEAFVCWPDDADEHPGVLFFMDAIGLRPQIEEMCRRIASWGYVVLAPNVFHREGRVNHLAPRTDLRDPDARAEFMAGAMARVRNLTADLAGQDITGYLEALRSLPGVAEGPVATTGYCMGARLALRAAGLDEQVAAVGGWHGGGLVTDGPDSPHLALSRTRAQLAFGHADNDRSMPPEAVERLGAAIADAGLVATNEVYPGAPHGYTMADTSSYDEGAAERHFETLRSLLDRALKQSA
jgi:carboxymethylenebutenolidase